MPLSSRQTLIFWFIGNVVLNSSAIYSVILINHLFFYKNYQSLYWCLGILAFIGVISYGVVVFFGIKLLQSLFQKKLHKWQIPLLLCTFLAQLFFYPLYFFDKSQSLREVIKIAEERSKLDDYRLQVKKNVLFITGPIGPGLATKVIERMERFSINKIIIDSRGGLLDEAFRLIDFLEKTPVIITAQNNCSSSCILIFLAGSTRVAEHSLQFGFHLPHSIFAEKTKEYSQFVNEGGSEHVIKKVLNYLKRKQVPQKIITYMYNNKTPSYIFIPAADLLKSNVVTALIKEGHYLHSGIESNSIDRPSIS